MGTNKINHHRHADCLKEQRPPEMGANIFAISKEYHCVRLHCLQLPHGKRCAFKKCIKRLMYYIKQFVKHSSSSSQTLSSLWRCLVKQKSLSQMVANTFWPNINQTKRLKCQTISKQYLTPICLTTIMFLNVKHNHVWGLEKVWTWDSDSGSAP